MAKIQPTTLINTVSGKTSATERISFRTRYGKVHTYTLRNPSTAAPAPTQLRARSRFAEARQQAFLELKNPERHAYWSESFQKQNKYVRLDCFVTAQIMKQK